MERNPTSDSITLGSVALDCSDAGALADFYATITGGSVTFRHASWATVRSSGARIDLQTVPGHVPPAWARPDLGDPGAPRLRRRRPPCGRGAGGGRGATLLAFQPNDDHCLVYADPAGHPFCLSTQDVG